MSLETYCAGTPLEVGTEHGRVHFLPLLACPAVELMAQR